MKQKFIPYKPKPQQIIEPYYRHKKLQELCTHKRMGGTCITRDLITFREWATRKIDTNELIRQFKENNRVDPEVYISPFEMVDWLGDLGWRR